MTTIRPFQADDWDATWRVIEPVFRAGETYAVDPAISELEARRLWVELPAATFVVIDGDGTVLGSYYLKPNQAGPGSHVCNCGYIVAEAARGRGLASLMCRHSLEQARAMGFRAMQYNLVVSTNGGAIRLWRRHGFHVAGRLPGAFRHPVAGDVEALVMYRSLMGEGDSGHG